MNVREISFVSRPAGVTTRLLGIPVDNADLVEAFGPEFEVGMPVSCDKCLNGCWGFNEFDPDALREGDETPESGTRTDSQQFTTTETGAAADPQG